MRRATGAATVPAARPVLTNVTAARSAFGEFRTDAQRRRQRCSQRRYQPVTDGRIIVRYMQGLRGDVLVAGSGVANATVTRSGTMASYLDSLGSKLDIDGNGTIDATATDGLLIARYMLGSAVTH